MASQAALKQRTKDDQPPSATTTSSSRRAPAARKMAMARRGARSLALAVLVPLVLTCLSAYLSGCSVGDGSRRSWRPPAWAFHLASAAASGLMGLSAWLVWAEGGFHRDAALLPLYSAQLAAALLWGPTVLGHRAGRAGLALCAAGAAAAAGCARRFGRVNPLAGDLVKPCLAWLAFLAVFTYNLID